MTVSEIPVLLKGPLVLQFLAGRKTVTRRTDLDKWSKAKPGDLIWFREAHAFVPVTAFRMSTGVQQITDPDDSDMCAIYRAGWERSASWKWRPSLFMPKWAARCWAVIESVREERLQDITEEDAVAEGIERGEDTGPAFGNLATWRDYAKPEPPFSEQWIVGDSVRSFISLWDSINGKKPGARWADNPMVARIEFRRIER